MADIALAAGIGKGTIYEYYRSKEEIFGEAFKLVFDNMEIQLAESIGDTDDPTEKLRRLIDVSLKGFLENTGNLAAIMMDFWAEGIRNKDANIMNLINLEQIYSEYRLMIADILYDGIKKGVFRDVDAPSLAAVIIGALDGIMLQWIINKDVINIAKVSEVIFDTLINGIKVR
jgi:AcrR family transcriptional regulator